MSATAPGPSGGSHRSDAVFPAILLALVIPAFKNRTTLDSGVAAALRCRFSPPFPLWPPDWRRCSVVAAWPTGYEKNNGQYDAIYYRYCSLSAGNASDAPRRRETSGSRLALFGAFTGAFPRMRNGAAIPSVALATTFYEAGRNILPNGARSCWASPYFSPSRKCRLLWCDIAAAVVTKCYYVNGGYN